MATNDFLGQGIKWPLQVDSFGRIALQSGPDLIKQSLKILFQESVSSELFREHYGSRMMRGMFEPNDAIIKSLLDFYIVDAIERWERRIEIVDIKYDQPPDQPALINCTVFYTIKQSSEIDSFIYPYYRELKN
jgi:phage baseplate assembly protein W